VFAFSGCNKKEQPSLAAISTGGGTFSLMESLNRVEHEYDSLAGVHTIDVSVNSQLLLQEAISRLSVSLDTVTDPATIFSAISDLLYNKWNITFGKNPHDPDAIFPYRVISNRRGTCLGMSLLVLVICEKLDFPVHGVIVPGHFFVRFDNGRISRSFETLRNGEAMSESWYRMRWSIKDTVRYSLKNCTIEETLAAVYYTLGNSLHELKKWQAATIFYKRALEAYPGLIEAAGNMAISLDAIGDRNQAIVQMTEISNKYPDLENVHSNLASLLLNAARYRDAEKEYRKALVSDPGNAALYMGLAIALYSQKHCDESKEMIENAINLRAEYHEALQFKQMLDTVCFPMN
jgi:tetratricopeptide (TPR) repeat protein